MIAALWRAWREGKPGAAHVLRDALLEAGQPALLVPLEVCCLHADERAWAKHLASHP